jgi:hypothetical protein
LCGGWIAKSKVPHPPNKALKGLTINLMAKIKLKIKRNSLSPKGFRMFNLTAGQKVEFTFAGEAHTRTTTKSWWILMDDHANFSKAKFGEGKDLEIDTSEYKLQKSEFTDDDGKTRYSTWLVPNALADDSCEEWV